MSSPDTVFSSDLTKLMVQRNVCDYIHVACLDPVSGGAGLAGNARGGSGGTNAGESFQLEDQPATEA